MSCRKRSTISIATATLVCRASHLPQNLALTQSQGTHARTQGLVKGKLIVPDDLPKHLKQGELFEKGGEYPVVARYSTEPGDPGLDDRTAQPRGFAMKVFNVKGDFLPAGKDFPTQVGRLNLPVVIRY